MSTRWDAITGRRYAVCLCGDPRDAGAPMCASCLRTATPDELKLALWRQEKEGRDG